MTRVRLSLLSLAAIAALAVAGCGSDDERSGDVTIQGGKTNTAGTETEKEAAATGKPVETINVSETEFKLDPPDPSIGKAGVVEFKVKNAGQVVHALEVEGPNGEARTESIQPGKSATLKADLGKAGSFEWYCPIGNHKNMGMKGEIKVAGGGSGSGSGGGTDTSEDESKTTEDSGGSAY